MARKLKEDTEHKNLFKRGSVWWVQAMRNGERFIKSTGHTDLGKARGKRDEELNPLLLKDEKKRAEAVYAKVQTAGQKLTRALDALPALPVRKAWDAFLSSPQRSDAGQVTLDGYLFQWNRFEKWIEARRPGGELRAVNDNDAGDYATDLTASGMSPNRFNKHVDFLRMLYRVLADAARIGANPWEKVRRKRLSTQGRRAFTVRELQTILETASGELQTLLIIGAYSGLRLGDAASLDWSSVDLANGMITLRPKKTAARTGKIVAIPLHPTLHAVLERTPHDRREGPVMPEISSLTKHQRHYRLMAHFKACKIETTVSREGAGKKRVSVAGFHALRHTIVSQLASKGVPLEVIRGLVGHGGTAMTQAYVHQNAEAARAAVGALQGMACAEVAEVPPAPADAAGAGNRGLLAILEGMTAETWQDDRQKALEMFNRIDAPKGETD